MSKVNLLGSHRNFRALAWPLDHWSAPNQPSEICLDLIGNTICPGQQMPANGKVPIWTAFVRSELQTEVRSAEFALIRDVIAKISNVELKRTSL